jgi:threonine synthase
MDINIASNFERYLHAAALEVQGKPLSGADNAAARSDAAAAVRAWHSELAATRRIASLPAAVVALFSRDFTSSASTDADIDDTVKSVINKCGYAACPHTATALHASATHESLTDAASHGRLVVCATAHPAKFAASTPALAAAGLYFEQIGIAPEFSLQADAVESANKAFSGPIPQPELPASLSNLSSRPSRAITLAPLAGQTLAEAVKALIEQLPMPARTRL